ncbi:TPA: hypothetical protein ACGOYB_000341 [Streptococcus suis]
MTKFSVKENLYFEKEEKTYYEGDLIELTKTRAKEINEYLGTEVLVLVDNVKDVEKVAE